MKRPRSGSISKRLRNAAELCDAAQVDKETQGVLKDIIIRDDPRLQEAMRRIEQGDPNALKDMLADGMLMQQARKNSIDLMGDYGDLSFDFLHVGDGASVGLGEPPSPAGSVAARSSGLGFTDDEQFEFTFGEDQLAGSSGSGAVGAAMAQSGRPPRPGPGARGGSALTRSGGVATSHPRAIVGAASRAGVATRRSAQRGLSGSAGTLNPIEDADDEDGSVAAAAGAEIRPLSILQPPPSPAPPRQQPAPLLSGSQGNNDNEGASSGAAAAAAALLAEQPQSLAQQQQQQQQQQLLLLLRQRQMQQQQQQQQQRRQHSSPSPSQHSSPSPSQLGQEHLLQKQRTSSFSQPGMSELFEFSLFDDAPTAPYSPMSQSPSRLGGAQATRPLHRDSIAQLEDLMQLPGGGGQHSGSYNSAGIGSLSGLEDTPTGGKSASSLGMFDAFGGPSPRHFEGTGRPVRAPKSKRLSAAQAALQAQQEEMVARQEYAAAAAAQAARPKPKKSREPKQHEGSAKGGGGAGSSSKKSPSGAHKSSAKASAVAQYQVPEPLPEDVALSMAEIVASAVPRTGHVGGYSPDSRRRRIDKFLEKRQNRIWMKRVKYDVRKNFADSRLRVKGRFVKKEDEEVLRELLIMTF